MTTSRVTSRYSEENIKILDGLEAVRLRPGMYVGSTGSKGLHHLVWEVIDNSVDEHLAGYGNVIRVTVHKDNRVTVEDEGRGIPVGIHPKAGIPTVQAVLTILHAGGKFDNEGYKVSGGLHGVGISVVNALSKHLVVIIRRDGVIYRQEYSKGVPLTPLEKVGQAQSTGTTITFLPDDEIFDEVSWNTDILVPRLREYAFLNSGLTVEFTDERVEPAETKTFCYTGGIMEYVRLMNEHYDPIHPDIFFVDETREDVRVQVAFQYNDDYSERIFSFANNIKTVDGGYHETGFKSALTRCLNNYGKAANLLKGKTTLTGQDVREGLTCVLSVYLKNPQFEGQTKGKLGNSYVRAIVESIVAERLAVWLDTHPDQADAIVDKALKALTVRESTKTAREIIRKSFKSSGSQGLPGKLTDCRSKNPEECELFIVEGDSAGGTAKLARNRETQAVLPIKGKILNVERARLDKVLSSEEIANIIQALGCGIGDDFDLSKLRYHKVIILVDADVDGSHISTLLQTFFFRHMPKLIEAGHVYFAEPPLYRVTKGKEKFYIRNDEELQAWIKKHGKPSIPPQRFKGLGEMQPEQLAETTMNPKTRRLVQLEIGSVVEADRITSVLMGKDVEGRRRLIETHNLDIPIEV